MRNISDYEIRLGANLHTLAEQIRRDIKEGWQPLGSVQLSSEQPPKLFQAIVKYE